MLGNAEYCSKADYQAMLECASLMYISNILFTLTEKNHTISPSNKAGVFRSSSLQILQLIFISLHMEVHGPVINFKMSALKKCKKLTNQ